MASPGNRHCAACVGTLSFPWCLSGVGGDARCRYRYCNSLFFVLHFTAKSQHISAFYSFSSRHQCKVNGLSIAEWICCRHSRLMKWTGRVYWSFCSVVGSVRERKKQRDRGLGFVPEGEIRWPGVAIGSEAGSSNNDCVSRSFINHTHTVSAFLHSVTAPLSTPVVQAGRQGDRIAANFSPRFLKICRFACASCESAKMETL